MSAGAPRGKQLLVVEDNEIQREGMALVLGREGYAVACAADGAAALALLRGGLAPSLILLDMLTDAGMDGWRFLQVRERDPALAATPVVLVTAVGVASPEWAASLGADGYLAKPVETADLLATVKAHCR